MIINVNAQWRITVDQYNNFSPEEYVTREGGTLLHTGKLSKPFEGWVSKFF